MQITGMQEINKIADDAINWLQMTQYAHTIKMMFLSIAVILSSIMFCALYQCCTQCERIECAKQNEDEHKTREYI